jgi:phosphopantetheine adenylyltransferase
LTRAARIAEFVKVVGVEIASLPCISTTVFVPTSPEWSFLASNLVKEVATYGGDVSSLAPGFVHEQLVDRVARNTTHVR